MKHVLLTAVFFCSISLIGCGGSGGGGGDSGGNSDGNDPVPTTSAEGLWNGTSSNNREITGLVLDDGTYWFIYSAQGNSAVIAGFIEGNGTSQNGSFTSSNGREFNLEGLSASDLTVNATYVMKQSFEGTAKYKTSGETVTIRGSYNTGYDNTPLLATVAGNYTGSTATSAGTEYATIFVSSEGVISGNSARGCKFSGNAAPRSHGNVYNVSITFAGGVCVNGTNTITGVAYFDASSKQIVSAGLNSSRSNWFIYAGTLSTTPTQSAENRREQRPIITY